MKRLLAILALFVVQFAAAVTNPIINADFSDPDVIVHKGVFYMVSSSFSHFPGVPVLTSSDGVNWKRLNYVLQAHPKVTAFGSPQHGKGIWAPCIRVHNGRFYVFMPDPDFGIYVATSDNPADGWSEPQLLLPGKGIIDPTPLWYEGKAYLLHAWAKSRAGFNNVLTLREMSEDASEILDEGRIIIDGNKLPGFRTLEGPKFYKMGDYFYVFAPAGGVKQGWQTVFRSRSITGPYEYKITLEQGMTAINGPHQGALIEYAGQDWFYHFQDVGIRGRIVHRQPVHWHDDWPFMGADIDGNGVGEPVLNVDSLASIDQLSLAGLGFSDLFDNSTLGLQWQWQANPSAEWFDIKDDVLILNAQPKKQSLWYQPAVLTQMLIGPTSTSEVTLDLAMSHGELASGLVLMGQDYVWLGIQLQNGNPQLIAASCLDAAKDGLEQHQIVSSLKGVNKLGLQVNVNAEGQASFAYRLDGADWQYTKKVYNAKPGRWVGARVGMFAEGQGKVVVDDFTQRL